MAKKRLGPKRQRYIRERAAGKTQAKAAIAAGYSPGRADVTGAEIERDPEVRAAISDLVEKAMPLTEVLALLADHARSRIDPVATIVTRKGRRKKAVAEEWVTIDIAKAIREGKGHLIREMGYTQFGPRVKLVDSQAAALAFAKMHGALREKHEHTGKDGAPIKGEVMIFHIPDNGRAAS
jgi:phage terminase small subunit